MLTHLFAELERHAVPAGELQVWQPGAQLCGECQPLRSLGVQLGREPMEGRLALGRHAGRCTVGREEAVFGVAVAGQPARQALGHERMPRQRAVLRPRQLDALVNERKGRCQCAG
ncbi:hypothetical protein D9M68_825880 [compost metagenome]